MIILSEQNGHTVLWLDSDLLHVGILPEKGADICELTYKPAGVQFLLQTPAGLRPPRSRRQSDFLMNYEGGWQELFPNTNDGCTVNGVFIPMHGEAALLPWEFDLEQDDDDELVVLLQVRCQRLPFRLMRRMRLACGSPTMTVEGTVINEGDRDLPFVWGHHLVLGGNFLEDGCRLEPAARQLYTPNQAFEPATARLRAGQAALWPTADGRIPGERVDLRQVPGPAAHSHDDVFITGFDTGRVKVTNPNLSLALSLEWDKEVFPWMVLWMPYGGAELSPLTGIYGLGIEPWVSRGTLAEAIEQGQARWLPPGGVLKTQLTLTISNSPVG